MGEFIRILAKGKTRSAEKEQPEGKKSWKFVVSSNGWEKLKEAVDEILSLLRFKFWTDLEEKPPLENSSRELAPPLIGRILDAEHCVLQTRKRKLLPRPIFCALFQCSHGKLQQTEKLMSIIASNAVLDIQLLTLIWKSSDVVLFLLTLLLPVVITFCFHPKLCSFFSIFLSFPSTRLQKQDTCASAYLRQQRGRVQSWVLRAAL